MKYFTPGDNAQQAAKSVAISPGGEFVVIADGGNRRQGLAPEAEGGDPEQVVGLGQFAGGVTGQGQAQVRRGHAVPVVFNLQKTTAPIFDADRHAGCPRIQTVFREFLDHRRRTLDHLAGGDLVGEGLGENPDEGRPKGPLRGERGEGRGGQRHGLVSDRWRWAVPGR